MDVISKNGTGKASPFKFGTQHGW